MLIWFTDKFRESGLTQPETLRIDETNPPLPEITTQEATNAGVARATGVLALGNVASRVLGMARDITLTNLFGASRATDAFYVATLVPRTLYDLLIGGQLNGAIIPVLSEVVTTEGQDALWQLVSVLLSLVTAVLSVVALVLIAFAPQVVQIVGSGYSPATQTLATELLRLTAPALIFLSLFAMLSGTLYALRSFALPAFAGAIFNGCIALSLILLSPHLQVVATFYQGNMIWSAARPLDGIRAGAFGWLIGAVVQMVSQLPGLRHAHLRLTIHWRHPALRRIAKLYAPVMFSLIIDSLVRFFSYNFASQTGDRSLSYMAWATTLIQFPQGLVATAISIAILPTLARQSVLIARDGDRPFKDTLGLGLRLAITLMIPAALGLFVLGTPIVRLVFQHGAFIAADTTITTLALRLYLIGLPFAAVDLLLVYAFYARQDTVTPAWIGLVSLVIYMVVAIALLPTYGLFTLMLADSAKQITHCLLSAFVLSRRMNGFGDQRLLRTIGKTLLAAGVMGVVALLAEPRLEHLIGTGSLIREILLVGTASGISLGIFAALAALLRIEELRWLVGMLRRRLGH